MSTKKGYEELIGRAVIDVAFRNRLLKDPEATIKEEGFEVDDETMAKFKSIDAAAAEAAIKDLENNFEDKRAAG